MNEWESAAQGPSLDLVPPSIGVTPKKGNSKTQDSGTRCSHAFVGNIGQSHIKQGLLLINDIQICTSRLRKSSPATLATPPSVRA